VSIAPFTIDDLIAEWRKGDEPTGGKTTAEIASDAGITIAMARRIIKAAVLAGRLRPAQERRPNPMRAGWHYCSNVFVLVDP